MTDMNEFNKALEIFKANGYDELDTARMYQEAQQEAFTGESTWKEKGFKMATKAREEEIGNHFSPCTNAKMHRVPNQAVYEHSGRRESQP